MNDSGVDIHGTPIPTHAKDGREIVYWTRDDAAESLYSDSIEEELEDWAAQIWPDPMPETIEVYGYARVEDPPAEHFSFSILDRLLEDLDDEHADPNGGGTLPTDAMKAAALEFVEKVLAEYHVWSCDRVATATVRVSDFLGSEAVQKARESKP